MSTLINSPLATVRGKTGLALSMEEKHRQLPLLVPRDKFGE